MEAEDEKEQLRSSLLQTSASALQMRQRAEQEVRRANEALERRTEELGRALEIGRATLAATADAILVTSEENAIIEFNGPYLELWRTPREVLESGGVEAVWEYASRNFTAPGVFLTRLRQIMESDEESFDVLEFADGHVLEQSSKILRFGGRRAGRVWSSRDVTNRHVADLTARRLASIVASSDDAIIAKDLNSVVTNWNYGAERIFGYFASEMIGNSIMRLIPKERQAEEQEILSRIRRGERIDHFETVRVSKSGHFIDVSITVSPIKDANGVVVGASKIARDVTAARAAKRALEEAVARAEELNRERERLLESERDARAKAETASRMKDEFLATLSHELRTPLNAVLGWVTILKEEKCAGAELEEGIAIIERNARAQAQIIEDLLDMSRIISGKVRLDAQQVDLPTVLNESVDTVRTTAGAKGVDLQLVIDPFAGVITGDPHRLQQVFWNLLTNAIKFTPKQGKVRVRLQRIDSHVEVTVTDTGEGILPDFLPYVFDRFQQADASSSRRHGGLGLGLAIVKQLVELHGGRISVHSDGRDQGATFQIILPLFPGRHEPEEEKRHPRAPAPERPSLPAISLQGVSVLVVDDEADARKFVRRLLISAGALVAVAASVEEALEKIAIAVPDVLVCDIGMPGEDGYALLNRLRTLGSPASEVPALALTAYARSEDRTKAIRSGFQNHLAKPVEAAELLAVVARLAGK